jgi:hypothetical protein
MTQQEAEDAWKVQYLVSTYGIQQFASNGSYIWASDEKWPGYVIKFPKVWYPSYGKACEMLDAYSKDSSNAQKWEKFIKGTSPFQAVSRVFYANKIRRIIEDNNLKHVRVLRKFLVPVPGADMSHGGVDVNGKIFPPVRDENYIVLAEKVAFPGNAQIITQQVLKQMLTADGRANPALAPLWADISAVMRHAGIWSVAGACGLNIIIVPEGKNDDGSINYVAWFIDLEKPGLGGCEDQSFFQRNPDEVTRNAECGIKELMAVIAQLAGR